MSTPHTAPKGAQSGLFDKPRLRLRSVANAPRRIAPYDVEPGFYAAGGLWLYGNVRLLAAERAYVSHSLGPSTHFARDLNRIEEEAERIVLGGLILVCGCHNLAHQRACVVPLRWGAPRIL